MIKTITLGTLLTGMYNSPLVTLLIAIALVFLLDLYNRYLESKRIVCVTTDFSTWSYRSLQSYAKLHGIKANTKRATLINQLQGV
ncbi:MAG: Ish1 domain-containing protein [Cyanobacteria bacterium P01_G01_bin.39]